MLTLYVALSTVIVVVALQIAYGRMMTLPLALADLGAREQQLDGLRGLCALLVAAHHLTYFYGWFTVGEWSIPSADHGLITMGKAAVAVFFLLCAYLFWGKIARSYHRAHPIDYVGLVTNRVRRLVPMYCAAMTAAIVAVGFWSSDFHLNQTVPKTVMQVIQSYSFSILGNPLFNESFLAFAAISVSWSLEYEWAFYASLPILCLLKLPGIWRLALPAVIIGNETFLKIPYLDYFAYGALAYELSRVDPVRRWAGGVAGTLASMFVFPSAVLLLSASGIGMKFGPAALFVAFLPIACGSTWFGVLTLPALRLVGLVSYSLYLLNIVVFYVVFRTLQIDTGNPPSMIAFPLLLITPVLVSLVTYRWIERPFLTLSRPSSSARLATS
jgi:peptidoglycan/LPS O-acetylase OafA/YrhL